MIYTYEVLDGDRRVTCGLFTSDDLPGDDERAETIAYVEQVAAREHPGTSELRLWHKHLTAWSLLSAVVPDATWTHEPSGDGR